MLCVHNTDRRVGVGSMLAEAEEQLLKPAQQASVGSG